jgi:4-diphosphocytidyl-2-C-methyl-D-erythritol kinase
LTIALPARAKVNLDLAVLRRRDDGFHDVRTTLQAIDLHDLITLTPARTTTLTISGLNLTSSPDNSVLQAHAALEQAARQKLPTAIHLHKRIPPGAGMGGASSDAAATLRGLAALHHVTTDLTSIAKSLGSDVPFFLTGGTAIATDRGDHLTPIPTQPQWFALAWPEVELLTPDVYRAWDTMPGKNSEELPNQLTNAAMRIEPRLQEFANALNKESKNWQMTGSGSAFFRTAAGETEARTAAGQLKCWTAVAHSVGPWA